MFESIENMIFNGIDLASALTDEVNGAYFVVNSVQGRGVLGVENTLINIEGMDGAYTSGTRTPVRYLDVDITLKGTSFEDLRKRIERLNEILYTGSEIVPIKFSDESDRTYFGKLDDVSYRIELSKIYQATLTFVCPDPFKYGEEQTLTFEGDTALIENQGTAETYPIIEVELKEETTFVAVGNGEKINMIGEPASVDEIVFEPKTIILNDSMASMVGWGAAGFQPDGSVRAGDITSNGQAIMPSDYGTGTSWHGPAVQKSISEQLKDFIVEFTFRFDAHLASELGKIELYGLDATNKKIFMLGMSDNWRDRDMSMPIGRLYNSTEQKRDVLVRNENDRWEQFFGYLKITRIGNETTFFLKKADLATGEEIDTKLRRYLDTGNEYQQQLSSIGLHFAQFGAYPPIDTIYSRHINVWKVNQESGIPYIANAGDKVVFNHTVDLITLNDEEIKREKAFIGNYFPLKAGENVIIAEPEEAIEKVTVRWRERWR